MNIKRDFFRKLLLLALGCWGVGGLVALNSFTYIASAASADFSRGDILFLNACGGNPQTYQNSALNISNKIVEVPNKITKVEPSPYGRPIITEAISAITLVEGQTIRARLDNFRDLSIRDDDGSVIYKRRISGATSIYELKHRGNVVGWGVGWHKTCGEYYSHADFTVLRVIVPTRSHDGKTELSERVFRGIAERAFAESTETVAGLVLVEGDAVYSCGACSCYYCLPRFFILDNQLGFVELSDPESLKSVGVQWNKIEPMMYVSWLSSQGKKYALAEYIKDNFDAIVPSALKYQKVYSSEDYDENRVRKRKEECLKLVSYGITPSIQEVGKTCFPELESLSYFEVR